MAALRLRSLFECLGEVPECRLARGKRYPLNTVLALAVAARLRDWMVSRAERVLRVGKQSSTTQSNYSVRFVTNWKALKAPS